MGDPGETRPTTGDAEYARRLVRLGSARWKRLLDVQRPYRWNLRRLHPGFTLDLGCGIGRNLVHLGGNGIGVDQNEDAVRVARGRGLRAFTPSDFASSEFARPDSFDSMLCAHVVEHMHRAEARALLETYLAYVRTPGRVILITPEERGFRSDPTHVEFMDVPALQELATSLGLRVEATRRFPFPRPVGRMFVYNELIVVASKVGP